MKSQTAARPDRGSCVKTVAWAPLILACLLVAAVPGIAAQASAEFDVMITLRSAEKAPQTGLCDSSLAIDSANPPTVVCGFVPAPTVPVEIPVLAPSRPGAPDGAGFVPGRELLVNAPPRPRPVYEGSGFRYISYITGPAGSVDIFTAAGTSTAFRLVNWADREYIEMTVGW